MIDKRNAADGLASGTIRPAPERGFSDIVLMAQQICGTEIALISLNNEQESRIEAYVGPASYRSFCCSDELGALLTSHHEYLENGDLSWGERHTRDSPIDKEDGLEFYAGLPLKTPRGVVGVLAVLDKKMPRGGLNECQRGMVEKLACLAVDLLELRHYSSALEDAELRWRSLFCSMQEGFFFAGVIRDAEGKVCDWRYLEVNPAWEDHIGIGVSATIGYSLCDLFGEDEKDWIGYAAHAVDKGVPVHFTQRVRSTGRWYDGTFQPVGTEYFSATFREVTNRIAAERRQTGLVQLGDLLRDERDIGHMIDQAMAIIGNALLADRATYGELDHDIETLAVAEGWFGPGMPPIAGRYRFDDYGRLRETFLSGEALIITDVLTDPRTSRDAEGWLVLKARGVINIPVREEGRTVALVLVHFSQPHDWLQEEIHWLHNAADRIEVAIARRRAEEFQAVVNGEIAHRLRNTLAMVQAIARMTLRNVLSKEDADRFNERLQSLGRAHDLLHGVDQRAAALGALAQGVLSDASVIERCSLSGPTICLGTRASMSTALLLHEMTTNAYKHGALSVSQGQVEITWWIDNHIAGQDLVLQWKETGGPAAVEPEHRGFGSRLISFGLIGTGGVELRYEPEGLTALFRADMDKIKRT